MLKHTILALVTGLFFSNAGYSQIQGGVFSQKKEGISNAMVIAIDTTGKPVDTVRSDKRGFYSFKGLKPGKYNIEAKAPGYSTSLFKDIIANKEEADDGNERDDISSATRLEIVLKPVKE